MGRCSDARDRLLATAAQLVQERGYTAVSVADICKESGLKKGSFYHFFRSKHALILATLDRFAELHDASLQQSMQDTASVREQLLRMATGLAQGFRRAQRAYGSMHGCPLGNMTQEMAHRDPQVRAKLAEIFTRWQRTLAKMLERAQRSGELTVHDPKRAAEAIIAYLQGMILLTKATDDPDVFLRLAHGIVSLAQADLPTVDPPAEVLESVADPCQVSADLS